MSTVIVSKNVVTHPQTGQRTTSRVYHILGIECGNAPSEDSPHYYEVEEDIAIALGKVLCKSCTNKHARLQWQEVVDRAVARYLNDKNITTLMAHLPEELEFRIYAHRGGNTQPLKVWSSKD